MSVINSLKRLERAGAENSRSTEKLREAARDLSQHLVCLLGEGEYDLPRGYATRYSAGLQELAWWDGEEQRYFPVHWDREQAWGFAQDLATGWLDELAEWLESRDAENAAAIDRLRPLAEIAAREGA